MRARVELDTTRPCHNSGEKCHFAGGIFEGSAIMTLDSCSSLFQGLSERRKLPSKALESRALREHACSTHRWFWLQPAIASTSSPRGGSRQVPPVILSTTSHSPDSPELLKIRLSVALSPLSARQLRTST